jgi:molecular chaperone DnaJ
MIFLAFLPLDVFADSSIDISLDLPIYTKSDIITIFGNIEHDDSLNLMIIDPKADVILNEIVLLTQGEFTYNLQLNDYDLNTSGIYQISITYHDTNNSTEIEIKKEFFYDAVQNVNPAGVDIERISEADQIPIFIIAVVIILGIFLFLARHAIFRRKNEYDDKDWESKKNRDYEKYHSEWMSDEQEFSGKEKKVIDENEFLKSLQGKNIPDYYGILEIQKNSSQSEIKKQFRILAKKWHPDKKHGPDAEKKMAEINMAYGILSNQKNRKLYDQYDQSDDIDDKN